MKHNDYIITATLSVDADDMAELVDGDCKEAIEAFGAKYILTNINNQNVFMEIEDNQNHEFACCWENFADAACYLNAARDAGYKLQSVIYDRHGYLPLGFVLCIEQVKITVEYDHRFDITINNG